jgi:glycine cleavage system H protein
MLPEELKYTKEHEWTKIEGNLATVGITYYAQNELGDIVYVEAPKVGTDVEQSQEFGVVESVKSVSSIFSPLSGKIVEVNKELEMQPQLVNQDPYGKGWITKIELSKPEEASSLLSAEQYKALLE